MLTGRMMHGSWHPEMGHIRAGHDPARDPFPGNCPYHGDCIEGLAAAPAIEARWGQPAESLAAGPPASALEAHSLAPGLTNYISTPPPHKIILAPRAPPYSTLSPLNP